MSVSGYHVILPCHPVFSQFGIEVGNIGRSTMGLPNPGAPDTDPEHASTLSSIFEDLIVYYPKNDHGAGNNEHTHYINFLGQCVPNHPRIVHRKIMSDAEKGGVIVVPGDTFVVDPKGLPHEELCRVVVVSRTRDCCVVVLYNPGLGVFAVVHLSIDTLFGFHFGNGGILDEPLFELLGEPKPENIYAMLGPCISGIAFGPHACYEFGKDKAEQILSQAGIPSDRLVEESSKNTAKVNLAFGELIVRRLEHWGIRRDHMDVSCNYCTSDNFSRFLSARRGAIQKDNKFITEEERLKAAEELQAKRGNLTYARLQRIS